MRFNSQAYDKVFPRQTEVHEHVETAVETFRPSEEVEDVSVPEPEKVVEEPQIVEPSIEEGSGDDGSIGEPNSE